MKQNTTSATTSATAADAAWRNFAILAGYLPDHLYAYLQGGEIMAGKTCGLVTHEGDEEVYWRVTFDQSGAITAAAWIEPSTEGYKTTHLNRPAGVVKVIDHTFIGRNGLNKRSTKWIADEGGNYQSGNRAGRIFPGDWRELMPGDWDYEVAPLIPTPSH